MVKELLLGDNPFIGVSHLAQEKAKEEMKDAVLENKVKVIEAAIEGGATGFTFSTHESNLELLTYLNIRKKNVLNKMNYYILVPYAQSYVRKANIEGTPALIKSALENMFCRPSSILDMLTALIMLRPEKFAELFIEAELAPYLKILPRENVRAILLHEVLTELVMAFDLSGVVKCLDNDIRRRLGIDFGLETRNFGYLHEYISKTDFCTDYLMTPINSLGYQMAPNKESVEEAIEHLGRRAKILAINVLASGAIDLSKAIEYVERYKDRIHAVVSASANPYRIRDNFQKLKKSLEI